MRWAFEPEDQLADRGASTQADDDELGVLLLGHRDEVLGRLVAADQLADLVLDAHLVELTLDALELALEAVGLVAVEVACHHAGS